MITIQVTNANGRPCEVHISWGLLTHSSGLTDQDGVISFDVPPAHGTLLIDGRKVYEGELRGSMRVRK